MTGADVPTGTPDVPSWADLFARAPTDVSETTIGEVLADHRRGD